MMRWRLWRIFRVFVCHCVSYMSRVCACNARGLRRSWLHSCPFGKTSYIAPMTCHFRLHMANKGNSKFWQISNCNQANNVPKCHSVLFKLSHSSPPGCFKQCCEIRTHLSIPIQVLGLRITFLDMQKYYL
jgi:hypothetical protein